MSDAKSKHAQHPRAGWTSESIQSLLMIRYSSVAKSKFNACQTNKQKTAWWAWLSARLNVHTNSQFTPKQVKNKYTALKAEYRSLIAAGMETGNLEDEIKYPEYWECLLECMQVSWLHGAPLADSLQPRHVEKSNYDTEYDDSISVTPESKATLKQPHATERLAVVASSTKPEKSKSLGDYLVQGMGSMTTAMIEVAKLQNSESHGNKDLSPILAKIDKRLEEQSVINQAILAALQDLKHIHE
ncbi:unnamed protein product [Aphanomyces euteiches]|nr:hypothetical protein Ae201684P_019483 [Aphanomyces euteiches]KAH9144610.1 hypothetical protein AeRB84_011447 [Aphanomyces euteiches]